MSAVLKPAPAAPIGPAKAAWRPHVARIEQLEAEAQAPQASLAGVQTQLADIEGDRRELDALKRQRREALVAIHTGERTAVDPAKLAAQIEALELDIASTADEEGALKEAAAALSAKLAAITNQLHAEKLRGVMLLNALHREAITDLIPTFAHALEPAIAVWNRMLAHADAADRLRLGPDSGLPATAVGVQRDLAVPRLLNLPQFAELEQLLGAAQERTAAAARKYLEGWRGE